MPAVWAVAHYDGAVRRAIVASKEHGRRELAGPLGAALARSVAAAMRTLDTVGADVPLLLVPVPSSREASRRRGDDPLLRLARAAARAVPSLPSASRDVRLAPALRVLGRTRDQAGLDRSQRARNLRGRHGVEPRWHQRVAGSAVVLLDDVVTTGATLTEAARALRCAGAVTVAAAVVAATERDRLTAARAMEVGEVVPVARRPA